MNFRDYKTASKYAEQINAGYSARLSNTTLHHELNSGTPEHEAFRHGWLQADADEMKRKEAGC